MANILPRDLPAAGSVPDDVALIIDNGVNVQKATPVQIVTSGRPLANQAEAEAGTNPTKAMTPLTTAQAIAAQGAVQFATAAQGDLADSAVQPGDLATVATTGAYADLSGKPTLGTAAAEDIGDFATAAQGALADTAVQPGDLGDLATKDQISVPTDISATGTPSSSTYLAGDGEWRTPPGAGDMERAIYDPNDINQNVFGFLRGYLFGLTLSNAADTEHDITVAVGAAASDDAVPFLMTLASAITKRADATFAEGTANGGMVSGESLPTSGTVHVWLIMKADGTADVCFNNHASSGLSPTLPSGFTYKRRIGSLRTNSSANILNFIQVDDEFMLLSPIQDSTTTSLSTTAVSFGCSVPVGVKHLVIGSGFTYQAGAPNFSIRLADPDRTDVAVSGGTLSFNSPATNIPNAFGNVRVRANTSGQLRVRGSGANTAFTWNTEGWVDTRGRFA